jgi:hypothetical protein
MSIKEDIVFFNTSTLIETSMIEERCHTEYIQEQLKLKLPQETFYVKSAHINRTGIYKGRSNIIMRLLGVTSTIKNLPVYCEVEIDHIVDGTPEHIIIWSPFSWNDRFAGTAGGGTSTGGRNHITSPENTTRGWTVPYAIVNGFTAATTDSGNSLHSHHWAINKETRELNESRIESWRANGTHHMTVFGKLVAEILHRRPVKYSYFHGGSGGGRQALVEAQEFPEDYDGIWATCPAINWTKFVLSGLWPISVMNSFKRTLNRHKIEHFMHAVHTSVGGSEVFYKQTYKIDYKAASLIGQKTKGGIIDEKDAIIMQKIWDGPCTADGTSLWYGFWPGTKFWNVIIPIGSFYYSFPFMRPKPFIILNSFARWITRNPNQNFINTSMEEFEKLFLAGIRNLSKVNCDIADLSAFAGMGGKLIIDHGTDDPLIPVDGTIEYFKRLCNAHGLESVNRFCKFYLTPGDNHGNCFGNGPGITESEGMLALINWVENGQTPDELETIQINKKRVAKLYKRVR